MEKPSCKLLFVDDSDNDRVLFHVAVRRANLRHMTLVTALASGDELILYLQGEGQFANRAKYPFPDLIVLDLHMEGRTGFDVLKWIRQRRLPIITVVHSDSREPKDVRRALDLGASDYERKSDSLLKTIDWIRHLEDSWARWHAGERWRRTFMSGESVLCSPRL